jgi:hypothetical protein
LAVIVEHRKRTAATTTGHYQAVGESIRAGAHVSCAAAACRVTVSGSAAV